MKHLFEASAFIMLLLSACQGTSQSTPALVSATVTPISQSDDHGGDAPSQLNTYGMSWSPDGNSIAFVGGADIYIVDTMK